MRYFLNGDQLVITKDDFIDLQQSPAVFLPFDSEQARNILELHSISGLTIPDLILVRDLLNTGSGSIR